MTDKIARVCDYCGKTDVLGWSADSNGMVLVQGEQVHLLLMRDMREGEMSRPSFGLSDKHFCPECLPKAIQGWLKEVK